MAHTGCYLLMHCRKLSFSARAHLNECSASPGWTSPGQPGPKRDDECRSGRLRAIDRSKKARHGTNRDKVDPIWACRSAISKMSVQLGHIRAKLAQTGVGMSRFRRNETMQMRSSG